jgi:hypothetical protein
MIHVRTYTRWILLYKKYGRPDLLITFTTNPNWEEMTKEMYAEQTSSDRNYIMSRFFHLKLKELINLLT